MRAFAVPRYDTAFASSAPTGKKRPRKEDRNHLEWIRTLPCVLTGKHPVDAAHIRYADPAWGKRDTGKAEKPDDKWVVPLHRSKHNEQHAQAEKEFWDAHGVDPLKVASALYHNTGDDQQAAVILREALAGSRPFTSTRAALRGERP